MQLSLLAQTLKNQLSDVTLTKGLAIAREGRVSILEDGPDGVVAVVVGTDRYEVGIERVARGISAHCSCVAFWRSGPCKHLWATLVEAEERRKSSPDWGAPNQDAAAAAANLAARRFPWEERLRDVRTTQEQRRGDRRRRVLAGDEELLVYDVEIDSTDPSYPLVVGLRLVRERKGGDGHTRGARVELQDLDPDERIDRLDRRILRRLMRIVVLDDDGSRSDDTDGIRVPAEDAAETVRLLVRSGRCFVRRSLNDRAEVPPLREDGGSPWCVEFSRVELEAAGLLEVTGTVVRGEGDERETLMLDEIACWLPPADFVARGALHRIEDKRAGQWLADLLDWGPIYVPSADVERFDAALLEAPDVPANLPPAGAARDDVAPVPVLQVDAEGDARRRARKLVRAHLSFAYEDLRTDDSGRGVVGDETLYLRDQGAELDHAQGLRSIRGVSFLRKGKPGEVTIERTSLQDVVLRLLERGWIVEVEKERLRPPGTFSARVRSGQDWFDLEGGIDFDGEIAPLPAVLRAARAGEQYVRLADGSRGLLPPGVADAWSLMAELALEQDDSLRFARSQGWLLDALLMSRQGVEHDAGFSDYRERLAAFEGIQAGVEPAGFHGVLRDYQREALGWFSFLEEFGWGGCLADDMGLGKTVQVLALLERRREAGIAKGPSLVVVPRSVVFNWIDEAARFAPELRVLDYTGTGRKVARESFAEHDLVVTTFGTLRRDVLQLAEIEFDYAILDEAQNIKNPTSQAAKAARLLRARHRLALTGTPVENHLSDLWSLFEFLNPGMLGRVTQFRRISKGSAPGATTDHGPALIARAIRPFLLRRTKEQVAPELPARTEQVVHCVMPAPQRKLYHELRDHYRSLLLAGQTERRKAGETIQVLEALLRLRQAACHAALVEGAARDTGAEGGASGKLDTLMEMLPEATVGGHKALVFSQFTTLLARVRERLDAAGIEYLYLDGSTRKRKPLVEKFQNEPEPRVFLISLKAGGTGLNLTAADYVFLLDPWWNPAVEAQAIDRTHRIGQDRSVMAYRLIASDTVEERVLDLQREKRALADAVVNEDNALLRGLTREDLALLLG